MVDQVDTIVEAVRADLLRRSELGIAKYGVTLDRKDLGLRDWLQHAYEETLDQANYLKRAIIEIDQRASAEAEHAMASHRRALEDFEHTFADTEASISRGARPSSHSFKP